MPGYHLPWFAAGALGIDRRHGLKLDIVEPEPGPGNTRAVAAGQYDICLTSVNHYLTAKRDDPALAAKFVFIVAHRPHMAAIYIEARPAAHGRPIEGITELAGASVLGEATSPFVREHRALLARLGLEPGPTIEVPYEDVMLALATGTADIAPDHLDLLPTYAATAQPCGLRAAALPYHRGGLDVYGSGIVASTDLIRERPDAVRRLVAVAREALLETRENPAAGLELLCTRFPAVDRNRALAGWRCGAELIFTASGEGRSLGAMDEARWQRTVEHFALAHGGPMPAVETVFDGSFVPTSGRTSIQTA
jgi:ABC-type nitrate/sulfonate/bicarbonate transport system substrate-binding protein